MENDPHDEDPTSLPSRAASQDQDYRIYPLPSGRRGHSPRTLTKRAIEAGVVVCLTLFCLSAWNKAMAPKESPVAPALASPFTLLIDQGEKFLVLPADLVLEPMPSVRECEGTNGSVPCFKLLKAPSAK